VHQKFTYIKIVGPLINQATYSTGIDTTINTFHIDDQSQKSKKCKEEAQRNDKKENKLQMPKRKENNSDMSTDVTFQPL